MSEPWLTEEDAAAQLQRAAVGGSFCASPQPTSLLEEIARFLNDRTMVSGKLVIEWSGRR